MNCKRHNFSSLRWALPLLLQGYTFRFLLSEAGAREAVQFEIFGL